MKWKNIVGIGIVIWLVNQGTGFFKRVFGHHPEDNRGRIVVVERGSDRRTVYDLDDEAKRLGSRALEWIDLYNAASAAVDSHHNRHVAEEAWRDETRIKVKKQEVDLQKRIQDLDHRARNQELKERNASWKRQRQAADDAYKRKTRTK